LSEKQLEFIAGKLPYPKAYTGRPAYSNRELLPGILKVLRSGCRWRDLNLPDYPDGTTHWRRLQFWKRKKNFRYLWEFLLRMLRQQKLLVLERLGIDGSLMQSFAFQDKTGYSGKHHRTGVKMSVIVEGSGIPIAMVVAKGNIVDITLADATVDNIRVAKSAIQGSDFLGDKGYDCLAFRIHIAKFGSMPNIPKRITTKVRDKYIWYYIYNKAKGKQRYVVERTNAWLKSFRRLRMRFAYKASSFEAFLYLAILVICVRRLLP
jgi:putative transposase